MNRLKVFFILAAIVSLVIPVAGHAYQIAPNPNPSGSTISVTTVDAENATGGAFDNQGTIAIDSGSAPNIPMLINNGTLNNAGTVNNAGAFKNGADALHSGAILNNTGTWNNIASTSKFDSWGAINNLFGGILYNEGDMNSFTSLTNSGTLTNAGELKNSAGTFTNTATGSLTNTKNMYNSDTMVNSGAFVNNASGSFTNGKNFTNNTTITNAGSLANNLYMVNNGTLNNTGTGTFSTSGAGATTLNYGTITNALGGTVYNSASLESTGTLNNAGNVVGTGTYTQKTSGSATTIMQNAYMEQAQVNINTGSLTGTGTIKGAVTLQSGTTFTPGNLPNTATVGIGTMNVDGSFSSAGNMAFDIANANAADPLAYDRLVIHNGGAVNVSGGTLAFDFTGTYHGQDNDWYYFLTASNITNWVFSRQDSRISVSHLAPGLFWEVVDSSLAGTGQQGMALHLYTAPVPLPPGLLLFAPALGGLFAFRKRFGKKS